MRLKQKIALLLSGVMLTGLVAVVNPVEVKAIRNTEEFTLTVPANTSITKAGWNSIGDIKVTGSIDASKKVTVAISTANGSKLKSGRNEVPYTIKKEKTDSSATSSIDFDAAAVNGGTAIQGIGADVSSFSGKPSGTYEDTINFTAALVTDTPPTPPGPTPVTYTKENGGTLSSEDLGTKTDWVYGETTYEVYNGFIPASSGSSWNDAMGFVAALNAAGYDGHDDWKLLGSEGMAKAWYQDFNGIDRGGVSGLWSLVVDPSFVSDAYFLYCDGGNWTLGGKSRADSAIGFVVLRGTPAPVTYNRSGKEALSSENLGTKTDWEYDGTTYEVYNGFIPSSSESSWNDAMGFVAALNAANGGLGYNDHKDWKLLVSKEMAMAWNSTYGYGGGKVDRGNVDFLWSPVGDPSLVGMAYGLRCGSGGSWGTEVKSDVKAKFGFVVLRGTPDH